MAQGALVEGVMLTIKWTEKHKGVPNTRSDYRQIDGAFPTPWGAP